MESQLHNIFDEYFQIKRISKEISLFSGTDEMRQLVESRMTYIRKYELIIHITLKKQYISKYRLDESLAPVNLKIIYTNSYPYVQPRLYFASENMNMLYTVTGRDYFSDICPGWTAKLQLIDFVPMVGPFLQKITKSYEKHKFGCFHRGYYIEMEPLYTLRSCYFYPIHVIINQKPYTAFLIISRFDLILLERSQMENFLRLVDAYSLNSIKCILRSKRTDKKILILFKLGKYQYGVEILTDEHENIVESIIQKKANAPPVEEPEDTPKESPQDAPPPTTLEQLNEEIVILESLLDRYFTQTTVNSLVLLYKRAIEYCSLKAENSHQMYLDKLRDLLSNETVQVLLNSTNQVKTKQPSIFYSIKPDQPVPNKKYYVIDLL